MNPSVLVMGAHGNMGTRYRTILRYLGYPYIEHEAGELNLLRVRAQKVKHVIIATPTNEHVRHIDIVSSLNHEANILCEKPIDTDEINFNKFMQRAKDNKYKLTMVNQYQYMIPPLKPANAEIFTEYNYYNSGKDGRYWDCINIIGLDRTGTPEIRRDSPIWKCTINGHKLRRDHVDQSYVMMIKDWLENPTPNLDYIERAHRKVWELKTRWLSESKLVPLRPDSPENAGET